MIKYIRELGNAFRMFAPMAGEEWWKFSPGRVFTDNIS
jgi:hypothetical protein